MNFKGSKKIGKVVGSLVGWFVSKKWTIRMCEHVISMQKLGNTLKEQNTAVFVFQHIFVAYNYSV